MDFWGKKKVDRRSKNFRHHPSLSVLCCASSWHLSVLCESVSVSVCTTGNVMCNVLVLILLWCIITSGESR